jgi:hypothetical protein
MVTLYDGNADVWMKLEFDTETTMKAFVRKCYELGVGIEYKSTDNIDAITPADVGLTAKEPSVTAWEGEPKTITMEQIEPLTSAESVVDLQIEYGVDEDETESA